MHHETYTDKDLCYLGQLIKALKKNGRFQLILPSHILPQRKKGEIDITFEITNKCNLRCKLCNIWQEKPHKEITVSQLKNAFSDILENYSIGSVALTGGEPFLHTQINQIYAYLHNLKTNGYIQKIGIYSNGYASEKINAFLRKNQRIISGLEIGISIDGMPGTHNLLRGKPNAFQKSMGMLKEIRKSYPGVCPSLKFTITPLNLRDLPKIASLCKNKGIPLIPKLYETNCLYYYHKVGGAIQGDVGFGPTQEVSLIKILRRLKNESGSEPDRKILQIISEVVAKHTIPTRECYTPLSSLFITASGDIHPCLYREPITNINVDSWEKLLFQKLHWQISEDGIAMRCPRCLAYHGLLRGINI